MRSLALPRTTFAALVVCCLLIACDQDHRSDPKPVEPAPSTEELQALSEADLRVWLDRFRQQARGPAVQASLAARRGADVARVLTRRSADVSYLREASTLLTDVALRSGGKDACDLLFENAKLLLVDLGAMAEGERAARDLVARFADDPDAAGCVASAQAIADTLADQPAVLSAHAAEAQRRSAEPVASPSIGVADADNASWVQSRVQSRVQSSGEGDAATLERVVVYGGREGARVVRVVLYLDRPAVYRHGEAKAEAGLPHRIYLDFDAIKLAPSVEATAAIGLGGLQRVRVLDVTGRVPGAERTSAGRMRVSFDVDDGVAHRLFFLSDPYRVVIDLQAAAPEDTLAAKVRTIVLDAGHGGHNTGAHGPHGLREAVVALDLTRRVRALLRHELPGTRVVLTRETNEDLSLEERTAIANGENAQLFVSIHLNAWATSEQGGVATFVLDTSDDSQALKLAARENGTEVSEVTELQKVLAGLYRRDQVAQSLKLAEAIHQQTLSSGRTVLPELSDRGVKRAMFYVLVGATMPAVLVEPSFITNPSEAQALTTDAYRDRLAAGIAAGITRYARAL